MELHAEQETRARATEGFDQPIRRAGFHLQAFAQSCHTLPMHGVDACLGTAGNPGQQPTRHQFQCVGLAILHVQG
ncbi:hypothetical protein D3C71_1652470 [compost metagenome]